MNTAKLHQNNPERTSNPLVSILDVDVSMGEANRVVDCPSHLNNE